MKYKVGDKVKIRKDLEAGVQYGSQWFTNLMCKHRGKETTITKVLSNFYTLKVDDEMRHWSEEMLEPICDFNIGDKVIFNSADKNKLTGVFTISEINTDLGIPYFKLKEMKECTWFHPSRFFKVPLFKVGQIVQFKNIKEDKLYSGTYGMADIEGKYGIITSVRENRYTAEKPGQDDCTYEVKSFLDGEIWCVTSASIGLVPAVRNVGTIDYYSKEDIIAATTTAEAMAQAVDNVKASPFSFKVGETVVVRNDLYVDRKYDNGCRFDSNMQEYKGKITTITNVSYYKGEPRYALKIDNETFCWSPSMLLSYTPGSDYDLDKQIINQQTKQNYENQLQREKARISRGDKYTGRAVCSRRCKAQITVGHLSYKEVTQ